MGEIKIKTHLIVSDVHEEYFVKWCGNFITAKPKLENGLPIFIVIGSGGRIELNTVNIKLIEDTAKRLTRPHGRESFTTDTAYIYLLEEDGNQKMMGKVVHNHIKQYQQMYDKFETF